MNFIKYIQKSCFKSALEIHLLINIKKLMEFLLIIYLIDNKYK